MTQKATAARKRSRGITVLLSPALAYELLCRMAFWGETQHKQEVAPDCLAIRVCERARAANERAGECERPERRGHDQPFIRRAHGSADRRLSSPAFLLLGTSASALNL